MGTSLLTGDPDIITIMTDIVSNEWNVQWFELWADPMACLKVCCCPLCSNAANLQGLGKSGGFSWFMACCFMVPSISMARTQTREKFGIEGEEMNDWCLSCCCPVCSEFQTMAETKKRNES